MPFDFDMNAISPVESGGVPPTGTIYITENGTVDVSAFASAEVGVADVHYATNAYDCIPSYETENSTITRRSGTLEESAFFNIEKVSNSAMAHLFNRCTSLDGVANFPILEEIEEYGLTYSFSDTRITGINFPELTTVQSNGLNTAFYKTSITTATFTKLAHIGPYAFTYTFDTSSIASIYFPALTSSSFIDNNTNAFNKMLNGCSNVTVHFPSNLQSVISGWSDVQEGFGGTSVTILYDLTATE